MRVDSPRSINNVLMLSKYAGLRPISALPLKLCGPTDFPT